MTDSHLEETKALREHIKKLQAERDAAIDASDQAEEMREAQRDRWTIAMQALFQIAVHTKDPGAKETAEKALADLGASPKQADAHAAAG